MEILELEKKHCCVWVECGDKPTKSSERHTRISIEYTIQKLYEAAGTNDDEYLHTLAINDTVAENIERMILELKIELERISNE